MDREAHERENRGVGGAERRREREKKRERGGGREGERTTGMYGCWGFEGTLMMCKMFINNRKS